MYEEGKLPDELTQSIFVPLAKKVSAKECSDFRTIALMSQVTKVLQKILLNGVKKKLRAEINECQYGFLLDKGTKNAIYVLRTLRERCREVNVNLYCCFIDYTKALDRVQHILFEILSERNQR